MKIKQVGIQYLRNGCCIDNFLFSKKTKIFFEFLEKM